MTLLQGFIAKSDPSVSGILRKDAEYTGRTEYTKILKDSKGPGLRNKPSCNTFCGIRV